MLLKKQLNFFKENDGSALVLFSLMLVIILGFAGLVIDLGISFNAKIQLRKIANAVVLSGAQELTNSNDSVSQIVSSILTYHNENQSLKELQITTDTEYKLKVVLEKEVPLNFLKLFNINSITVTVSSSSVLIPMRGAKGAVPLGIDSGVSLEYFKEYTLKVDSGDSEYGSFGILALSGVGARLYEQDLMYGYDVELNVGDIINTQTGNIQGKTRESINYRLSSSNCELNDLSHRFCPRIVLVLVYEPYTIESNQLKSVKVTGFAYFYIKSPMGPTDSSITGYFIKRAGSGYGDKNLISKGAYAIKLVE